jgi:D-xylose 1-dehydrogenase (NADP+, D-xylono-1,5-lactone-forming)
MGTHSSCSRRWPADEPHAAAVVDVTTRDPVRWGILGTGGINTKFLAGSRLASAGDVVAVASRDPERAVAYAAEHGIDRAHGSYEALLADPDVEAVYISLPNSLHHPWTMTALAAGKHVLCEKPYSPRPADVETAFAAADAAGLVLSEAFMWRHHPQVALLEQLMAGIGQLKTIRATFSFVLRNPADIRLRHDLDGGSLLDVGCYCVSGARLLAGEEPDEVYGLATVGPSGVDLGFTGILRFPGGVIAEFTSGFTTSHRGLEAIGTEGSFLATDPWQSVPATIVQNGVETRLDQADPYAYQLDDVGEAIRDGRPPLVGRDESLGQARTLDALRQSAAGEAPVRL